ncbi:MAG: L-arabinose isomerase, partial [Bacteroidota bacterium]|nr:L-arabinose isomerase [Bacteroidota bacterium]
MTDFTQKEVWFITGSQHLYGEETLKKVAANSKEIVQGFNDSKLVPVKLVHKDTVTTPDEITKVMLEANNRRECIGVVTWMHTFSPAKMWIKGLGMLKKPICHLHTQFNAEIPWNKIDMDFMNLNQSAHGDREFGFMMTRMRKKRKVIVGHWKTDSTQRKLGNWQRVALGWDELQHLKVARIGDNMRQVAVTEGDKVAAQMKFGMEVNAYDSSDVVAEIRQVT